MKELYLSVTQCSDLGVSYTKSCDPFWTPANSVMDSKRPDYQRPHKRFLEPLRDAPILIFRDKMNAPGWFNVVS